jgi:hypothetical protein
MTLLLAVVVSTGWLGGRCLAYFSKVLEGSPTLTHNDRDFKISFKYPVNNLVKHTKVGYENTLYIGPFKYEDSAYNSYYQSSTARGSNNSISMFITREPHLTYDYALIGFDVLKSSCRPGERKTYGDNEIETTLTATYNRRQINDNPAAVCIRTIQLDYEIAGRKQIMTEYSVKAKIYMSGRGSYSVYISARRNPPTATEKQVVQDILESFKAL